MERRTVQPPGGKNSRLGGNIQSPPSRVPRQNVRVIGHLVTPNDRHRAKIEHEQHGVALTRDEREAVQLINGESVWMVGTREFVPANDALRRRIDRDELIFRLYSNEDAARYGVVLRVPCLPAEIDRRSPCAGLRVDDDVSASRLVGDEDLVDVRRVRDAVRKSNAP